MTDSAAREEFADFLAHSLELESEAQERYGELAQSMAGHFNRPVADFFQRMAAEAEQHFQEVAELAAGMTLPQLNAWEFDWPNAEPPETASYEALHYRMSLFDAMTLALANECAAERYYRQFAARASTAETALVANRFADEELEHAAELERLMTGLADNDSHLREDDDDPHMPE